MNSAGNLIEVTISGGRIASDASTDAAKVTIAQIDGGYSIATANGAYIGGISGANKLEFRSDAIVNTISFDNDCAQIVSNTSILRFNISWNGFRYYKSVQQAPMQLYKLSGSQQPTLVHYDAVEATYTQSGNIEYWYDEDSKKYYTDANGENETTLEAVTVAQLVLVHYDAIAADCTQNGNIEYWHDEAHGRYFSDANGEQEITLEETVVNANGHSFGEWIVTEEPDVGVKGEEKRTCSVCFEVETREIEALPYVDVANEDDDTTDGFALSADGALKYYVDGEPTYAGVVKLNGKFYYINSTRNAIRNRTGYYVTKTNGIVPAGYYDFDENGVMTESVGTPIGGNLVLDPDGEIRYYDGDTAIYAGLVTDGDGHYYYINSSLTAVRNRKYTATKNNDLLPVDEYEFDEVGRMIDVPGTIVPGAKEGLVLDEDGELRFYVNGKPVYAGLVTDGDGHYYYINSSLTAVRNRRYTATKNNDLLPAAEYEFDEYGRIDIGDIGGNFVVDADGDIRYFADGETQYAGVVQDGAGNYYYINSAKKAVRSTSYYITKTNGLIPAGLYEIGADGVIVIE